MKDVVVGVCFPQPGMLRIVDAGLAPGIAVQMANAPHVAHRVARRRRLRMEAVVDDRQTIVTGLIDFPVGEACAEAVGIIEAVEVNLRLG